MLEIGAIGQEGDVIRPRVTERPLEEANDILEEMEEGRLRDRVVLTFG